MRTLYKRQHFGFDAQGKGRRGRRVWERGIGQGEGKGKELGSHPLQDEREWLGRRVGSGRGWAGGEEREWLERIAKKPRFA